MARRVLDAGNVDELKIDKDCVVDRQWVNDYVDLILSTCRKFGVKVLSIAARYSRIKGTHFYVKIEPAIPSPLANRMQWLLGDDCERVDFNRARIEVGFRDWNKLFWPLDRKSRPLYRAEDHEKTSM